MAAGRCPEHNIAPGNLEYDVMQTTISTSFTRLGLASSSVNPLALPVESVQNVWVFMENKNNKNVKKK